MADEQSRSLAGLYTASENKRRKLDTLSALTPEYKGLLESTIEGYQQCLETVDRVSLFSSNEALDDVATNDIQYFLINSHLAALYSKRNGPDHKTDLRRSQSSYEAFLKLLDSYDLLDKANAAMLERFREDRDGFSIVSSTDPAARRETKIKRFREEKELKQRLDYWRSKQTTSQDEEIARKLYIHQISLATHEAFQALELHSQELHILSLAPPPAPPSQNASVIDSRDRTRREDGYSDRLDGPSHLSAGLKGPLLDSQGRPLRPFTLLDKRQQLQQGVFRPDHSLPTMSIDEYLEEERRRGGIIEGGGPQSGMRPEPEEDNIEKADAETLKARAWDDYKDDNPKGAGNTLNRG